MPDENRVPTDEQFAKWVRGALRQIYDSPSLTAHPLTQLLIEPESAGLDRAQSLRRVLLEAIGAMRPPASTPAHSPDWRGHRILEMRYIEGLGPDQVMEQLALRKSQFFRDQSRVLAHLTDYLWERYRELDASRVTAPGLIGSDNSLVAAETERVVARASRQEIDVDHTLRELCQTVEPLAALHGTRINNIPARERAIVRARRVLFRQAALNVLTYAIDVGRGGVVRLETMSQADWVGVSIRATMGQGQGGAEQPGQPEARLDVCQRLMATMHGTYRAWSDDPHTWCAELLWPVLPPPRLLVIDDNQGFYHLFRRYLDGHEWQVIGAESGARAREIIAERPPTVITLDVLMPQEDGWELLMVLKGNAETRDIPVIVCSVLQEPQLALSLGADAYLVKPVTEQSLLQVLAPWAEPTPSPAPER